MPNKTKAALQGRQCQNVYQIYSQLITMIDQVKQGDNKQFNHRVIVKSTERNFTPCNGNNELFKRKQQALPRVFPVRADGGSVTAPLAQFIKAGCSLNQRRKSDPVNIPPTKLIQPFRSMPRCCNSLRIIRLIQAAKDSSPSCCWARSIISRNSGSRRNWNGGLPRLSFLCVDTSITPDVMCLCVMTHYTHEKQKATPRSVGARAGRLTTNANETSEAAMNNHITPLNGRITYTLNNARPAFTWLFLGTPASTSPCTPIVLRTEANTETEARERFPAWSLTFAAKIRTECAVVHHRSGVVMFDIAEVFHG